MEKIGVQKHAAINKKKSKFHHFVVEEAKFEHLLNY